MLVFFSYLFYILSGLFFLTFYLICLRDYSSILSSCLETGGNLIFDHVKGDSFLLLFWCSGLASYCNFGRFCM